ncbi:hypothetical protein TraAM80_02177 [Trypanosoma rangeli]|uniref:Uncharacterized protein n=1 Tax=Trypanosoma rangeli TaxID=5698 RepID=A0A422NVH6_TRYRA|nr:uncharacterized protein TraAM80_02177 [Trypanosoma rangeli]RNF09465.1 hypothetical protein TraAM80_02177 [Trypanosoma rangeli]|eukprot:RNF09465.1 hypothetical protein TraAM80_02177 [Trypanosoma rangeli]
MAETVEPQPTNLMSAQKTAAATPIDGLTFVDEAKLHSDFRRLRGNQLYYVSHCLFYEKNGERGESCIFALTPNAFFVLDHHGVMERASPYEVVTEMYQKKTKDKKGVLFNSAEHHLLLKIPSEIDCHVSFGNEAAFQKCVHVLVTLLQAHRGTVVKVRDVPANMEIELFCSEVRPEGYHTPREVVEIDCQRSHFETFIRKGKVHVRELLSQLDAIKAQIASREEELENLKHKGIDETLLRARKAELGAQQVQLHGQMSQKHDTCEGVLDTVKALQERLAAARENMEGLVEKSLAERIAEIDKKHEEATALRRDAYQKEKNAMLGNIAAHKNELRAAWASVTDARGRELVSQVGASIVALERETEPVYRLEKFLATINVEVQAHSDEIGVQNFEKQKMLNEREGKQMGPSQSTAAAAGVEDPFDDPLLVLSAAPTNAPALQGLLETHSAEDDIL